MEVTDGKTDYKFCTMSADGKYAAFAMNDGFTYRVYNLETGKKLDDVTRGNTAAQTRSMSLARDS